MPKPNSLNKKLELLERGETLYLETTLLEYPTRMRRVQVPDSKRPKSMAGRKFTVSLVTGVKARPAGEIVHLVCVERIK